MLRCVYIYILMITLISVVVEILMYHNWAQVMTS